MSNKFNLDASSLEPNLEKDNGSSTLLTKKNNTDNLVKNSKLPDISDVQKIFGSNKTSEINNNNCININNTESDSNSDESENVESIENSPQGREVILYLDQVLCDPKDNFSRSGKPYLENDHEVSNIAHLIKTKGLINPVEVCELSEPIERTTYSPYAKLYTHKVTSGYKRFAALNKLGYHTYRFTLFDNISEDDRLIHNGIENFGRTDPTDYDLAMYIGLLHRRRNWSSQRIAVEIAGKLGKVESLLLIATKLPPELLEVFKVQPTPEIRRDLSKVALIERDTVEETHKAMLVEWVRIQNEKSIVKKENIVNQNNIRNRTSGNVSNSKSNQLRISELRNEQSNAQHWFDYESNTFRPITDEMKQYGDALLRHLSDKKSRSIFK